MSRLFRREGRGHPKILVLLYHSYHPNFHQFFEDHVRYLKEYCHLLSPQEFYEISEAGRKIQERSVLITLDDGPRADYTVAFPILKRYGGYAISFVITDPYYTASSGKEWWKEVEGVMEIGSHTVSHAEIFISKELTGFVNPIDGEIKKMYCMVKGVEYQPGFPLYQRGPELVNRRIIPAIELIERIRETAQETGFFGQRDWHEKLEGIVHRNPWPYRDETEEMKGERIKREIQESKLEIEKITQKECRFFSYPWGAYNEEVIEMVKEAGYRYAFSTREGLVFPGEDPFQINRVNIPLDHRGVSIQHLIEKFFPRR